GGRDGPPTNPEIKTLSQQIALLDFGHGKQAVFDFVGAQYFSPVRTQRVAIRGERGEIVDHSLHGYNAAGDAITLPFHRHVAGAYGNLEGMHLKGIQLGEEWLYHNLTAPARLSDEEIAMADLLQRMGHYTRGGPEPYPLRYALQDHYLGLCIKQACETGQPQTATRQVWASDSAQETYHGT
ncbi:MAG TPA: gfo/Idh/MocA family oxidoreductase, partial [Chloroflexota bacterium]|nr:gfo/Idh/MocA family oxidoreductase [Chloroflexota bacterium]